MGLSYRALWRGVSVRLRDFNSSIVIGIICLLISTAGIVRGNAAISEPGMPVHPHAWQIYLAAAAIMLFNGFLSVRLSRRAEERKKQDETDTSPRGKGETANGKG